jgi:hypothetical protein
MDKKKNILAIITIFLLLVVFFLTYLLGKRYILKTNFENNILPFANKNQDTIFCINKIIFFSSCDAKNKNASYSNFTIENLYQYTDIALFLTSSLSEKNEENTLKNLWIENIKYNSLPSIGEPKLYFKSIKNFAKSDLLDENIINDRLDFNITSNDEENLNTPILYNNLANPITLSYVNQNIKTDYTITDVSLPITYDGSLLKRCQIIPDTISCNLSLDIYIINNLNQTFKCTVYINIPLETEKQNIYDGNLKFKKEVNYTFYRY